MIPVGSRRGSTVSPDVFYELRNFYLDQLDARDRGLTQRWLDVFDEDATITTKVIGDGSTPVRKRDFVPQVWKLDASFHEKGIQRRHCVQSFTFTTRDDGLVVSRFYGLFLVIDAERGSCLQSAAMISDVLRRHGPTWRVISREIERDDLGRLNTEKQNVPLG